MPIPPNNPLFFVGAHTMHTAPRVHNLYNFYIQNLWSPMVLTTGLECIKASFVFFALK